jgi:hypothetical protein
MSIELKLNEICSIINKSEIKQLKFKPILYIVSGSNIGRIHRYGNKITDKIKLICISINQNIFKVYRDLQIIREYIMLYLEYIYTIYKKFIMISDQIDIEKLFEKKIFLPTRQEQILYVMSHKVKFSFEEIEYLLPEAYNIINRFSDLGPNGLKDYIDHCKNEIKYHTLFSNTSFNNTSSQPTVDYYKEYTENDLEFANILLNLSKKN